jgi:hypothetical protein
MDEAPFTELIAGLRRHGREADAAALDSLRVVGWKSSPDMVGELGRALRELELPEDLQPIAERCMKEIRRRLR